MDASKIFPPNPRVNRARHAHLPDVSTFYDSRHGRVLMERRVLPHVPSASGARYQEGGILFWDNSDSALVEVDGRRFTDCRLNASNAQ